MATRTPWLESEPTTDFDLKAPGPNPFPGLRPFREEEEHLFFGRERQVDRTVDKLAATRFLAVVGTSGCGKSSLVNCGLRPALHRGLMADAGTCWRMAQFRPGRNPIRALARALAADDVLFPPHEREGLSLTDILETTLRMSRLGLADAMDQANLDHDTNLIVIVDQFEELFRYRDVREATARGRDMSQDALAFVNLLLAAVSQQQFPIYIVLTMRSDFLGDCAQFSGLPEAINEGQYLVPRMTRDERRAAIAGPVAVGGGQISPVLLTRLVNDVGDNPDQLSILQHALNRSWASWRRYGTGEVLSLSDYEAIGTMEHALDRHADKAFGELDERQREICARMFKALCDRGTDARGIRRPLPFEQLVELTGGDAPALVAVIDVFRKPSRSFLMPPLPEEPGADTVIDISHESLMRVWKRLRKWADEEAQSAQMFRRTSETAALYVANKAGLWGDPDLELALEWRRRESPTAAWARLYRGDFTAAMAFLESSRAVRDGQRAEEEFEQRWRRRYTFIAVLVLASFFLLGPAFRQALEGGVHDYIAARGLSTLAESEFLHQLVAGVLLGMGHLLVFFVLIGAVRQLYRRLVYNRILEDVRRDPVTGDSDAPASTGPTYASFGRRAMAGAIDLSLFWVATVAFTAALIFLDESGILTNEDVLLGMLFLCTPAAALLYDAWLCSSRLQATLGKRAMGIVVQDKQGRRLTFRRAGARFLAKVLSYLTLGIGYLIPLFTRKKQALHDLIVGTTVVRRPRRRVHTEHQDPAIAAPGDPEHAAEPVAA